MAPGSSLWESWTKETVAVRQKGRDPMLNRCSWFSNLVLEFRWVDVDSEQRCKDTL